MRTRDGDLQPIPRAPGQSVESILELQAKSQSESKSEIEADPGPRLGPLQGKQPVGR